MSDAPEDASRSTPADDVPSPSLGGKEGQGADRSTGMEAAPTHGPAPYRLSDEERNEAIAFLSDAFAEGRLELAEFEERMEQAGRAKFASDLDVLFVDLPHKPARPGLDLPRSGRRTRPPVDATRGPGGPANKSSQVPARRHSQQWGHPSWFPQESGRSGTQIPGGDRPPDRAGEIGSRIVAAIALMLVMFALLRFRVFILLIPAMILFSHLVKGGGGGCSGTRHKW